MPLLNVTEGILFYLLTYLNANCIAFVLGLHHVKTQNSREPILREYQHEIMKN